MSATERLERLLYLLPRAAQPDGARIDEVAQALGVSPAVIMADIEEATSRIYYHPAGSVDALNLSVEDGVVRLYGSEFNRPVRLTSAEIMALGLGLRVLAAEADADRRNRILALAQQLERELVTPALELQPLSQPRTVTETAEIDVVFRSDDFRGDIMEAIEKRVFCDIVYLKASAAAPDERRIAPVRLVYARGQWYAHAWDATSRELRRYRLDRMLDVKVTCDPHDFDDASDATPFSGGGRKVRVRYSAQVARWIAEGEHTQCEEDGTLLLEHDVADMDWLVRHVLQYGGEAVVEGEEEARAAVCAAVQSLLSA